MSPPRKELFGRILYARRGGVETGSVRLVRAKAAWSSAGLLVNDSAPEAAHTVLGRNGYRMRMLLCFAAGFGLASVMLAQRGGQVPDAVAADPRHYSVSFENELVRLLRVRYGA